MIRNKEVAGKIIAYDQFNNDAVKNIFLFHSKFYENATPLRSRNYKTTHKEKKWLSYL